MTPSIADKLAAALKACLQCFDEMKGRKPAFVEDSIAMSKEAIEDYRASLASQAAAPAAPAACPKCYGEGTQPGEACAVCRFCDGTGLAPAARGPLEDSHGAIASAPAGEQVERELPPLPTSWKTVPDTAGLPVHVYRAFQMRDYARSALLTSQGKPAGDGAQEPIGEVSDISDAGVVTATIYCRLPAGTRLYLQPSAQAAVGERFVPMAISPHTQSGTHPNDKEPRSDALRLAFKERGDSEGQGLDPYWKWAFASGWNAALAAAPTPPASAAQPAALAKPAEAEAVAPLTWNRIVQFGRTDKLDFREPGTSRTEKVECVILTRADVTRLAAAAPPPPTAQGRAPSTRVQFLGDYEETEPGSNKFRHVCAVQGRALTEAEIETAWACLSATRFGTSALNFARAIESACWAANGITATEPEGDRNAR